MNYSRALLTFSVLIKLNRIWIETAPNKKFIKIVQSTKWIHCKDSNSLNLYPTTGSHSKTKVTIISMAFTLKK